MVLCFAYNYMTKQSTEHSMQVFKKKVSFVTAAAVSWAYRMAEIPKECDASTSHDLWSMLSSKRASRISQGIRFAALVISAVSFKNVL